MNNRAAINTSNAPKAKGPYSQAVKVNGSLYLSGQIPLIPATGEIVEGGISEQATQVFNNLSAVCEAAGGNLQDMVKLTIYITNLGNFDAVNTVMATFFKEPYPARATVGVNELPAKALVEIDGVMHS